MKKELKIPKFNNEDEERKFWDKIDITEYFEPKDFRRGVIFPNLKPSTESISLRLPKFLLDRVKQKANSMDIPYQSFIKILIQQGLDK